MPTTDQKHLDDTAATLAAARGPGCWRCDNMRIGTLNVHGWRDAKHAHNFQRLAAWLAPQHLDVLGLQEVSGGRYCGKDKTRAVHALGEALGMPHNMVAGDVAVLSRSPLGECALVSRDGDQEVLRPGTYKQHQKRLLWKPVA